MAIVKRRKSRVNFKNMTNKANPGGKSDENQFAYALNNKGVFECEMRFIEPPEEEIEGEILDGVPFIELMQHKYKDHNGREMTHQCRKMLPLEDGMSSKRDMCPLCTYVAPLWDEGREEEYREYKAKSVYVANVLIIKNADNPETEGKIYQLWFTYQIFNILKEAMEPEGGLEDPINPFDVNNAPNFLFKVRKKGKYNNYEASKFRETKTELTDEQYEYCENNNISLVKHLESRLKKVESYEKLAESFYKETGESPEGWTPKSSREDDGDKEESKKQTRKKPKYDDSKSTEEESVEEESVEEESVEEESVEEESVEEESVEEESVEENEESEDDDGFWGDV